MNKVYCCFPGGYHKALTMSYDDGKLVSVEFMTNFFFTTQNPLGIRLTAIWQWWLYLIIITVLACLAVFLCYVPLLRKAK